MKNLLIIFVTLLSLSGVAQKPPGAVLVNSIQQTVKIQNHNDSIVDLFNDDISFMYYYDSCLIEKIYWGDTTSQYIKTTSFEQITEDRFLHRGTTFEGRLPISLETFVDDNFNIFAIHVRYWVLGETPEEDLFLRVEHIIEKQN